MKQFIYVAGNYINTDRIDRVYMPNGQTAIVWVEGKLEPFHATDAEIPAIHEYVTEVMR